MASTMRAVMSSISVNPREAFMIVPRAGSAVPAIRNAGRTARPFRARAADGQRSAIAVVRRLSASGRGLDDVSRRGGRHVRDGDAVVGRNRARHRHAEGGEVGGILPRVQEVSLLPARHLEHETLRGGAVASRDVLYLRGYADH